MREHVKFQGFKSNFCGYLLGEGAKPSLLFLALVTVVNLMLVGYEFANLDQLLYLALVPRYFDPSTINPNDIYLHLFFTRSYTTFFLFLAPLIRVFGWEWPIFIVFVLTKFFTFWGVWSLAHWLTRDRWAAAFAVVFLLMNSYMKGLSVQFYSINLICRYAVIPFLFFALKRLWEQRYLAAAILFGLAFHIHAMSTLYWMVVIALGCLWNIREILFGGADDAHPPPDERRGDRRLARIAVRRLWPAAAAFTLLVLPVLIWRQMTPMPPAPADFSAQEWFDFSYNWKHSYAFFSQWSRPKLWLLALGAVLFCLPLRQMQRDRKLGWYLPLGLGVVLVMGIHYLATEIFPYQPIYQLQWYRSVDMIALFATLGVARLLSLAGQQAWRWVAALVAAFFLTAITTESGNLVFYSAAMLLMLVMTFEQRRRIVSAVLLLFGAIPAVVWNSYRQHQNLSEFKTWSQPMFCLAAALLFAVIFYLRTPSDAVAVRSGWSRVRRWLRTGVCALSLGLLVTLVMYVPDWRSRRHRHRRAPSSLPTRIQDGWNSIQWPGPGMEDDWVKLQLWARDNTPPQAMFFVPPGLNGFRVFSERSVFIENYDGETGIFSAVMAKEWKRRLGIFGYDSPDRGLWAANRGYHRLSAEDWRELSASYGADYIVTQRRATLPFASLHQQGRYVIWHIPGEP